MPAKALSGVIVQYWCKLVLDLILVPLAYVGIGHGLGIIVYLGSIYDRIRWLDIYFGLDLLFY